MSFSQKLAGKYILSQKRHSVFTILSITAAVLFITVVFTLFASYWDTMKNANLERWPWHAAVYDLTDEEIELFRDNDFVEKVEVKTFEGSDGNIHTDTYLLFTRDIHDPTTLIRTVLDESRPKCEINSELLFYELIGVHSKARFVMVFSLLYVFIFIFIICARFIIDTAFEISSKEREMQFGILASLGASRKQIVRIILWEGIILSLIAIPIGILLGIGASYIIFDSVISTDILLALLGVEGSAAVFSVPLIYMAAAAITSLIWVMLSAYGTGMRFAKKPPVEVIRRSGEKIKKVKKSRILGKLGGIVGTLASRNVRRNKKRFVITVVSITLSFALTVIMTSIITYTDEVIAYNRNSDALVNPYCHYFVDQAARSNVGETHFDREYSPEYIKEGYELIKGTGCLAQIEVSEFCSIAPDELALHENFFDYTGYDDVFLDIRYFNEEYYNYAFNGNPPVPYSELRGGNYVVTNYAKYSNILAGECPVNYEADGSFSGFTSRIVFENNLREGDNATLVKYSPYDDDRKAYEITNEIQGNIIGSGTPTVGFESHGDQITLIGCEEDYFDKIATDSRAMFGGTYYLVLSDKQRQDLQKTDISIKDYIENTDYFTLIYSDVDGLINTERFNSAMRVISAAIIILITVIALINEVNIISTGILNRRREIASLRALGMTKGQLTGMTLIECGLYSVVSAIATLLICEPLAFFINTRFVTGQEAGAPEFSYTTPITAVLLILIPVFLAGIITAFSSLSGFNKNTISEEMMAIE
ncbi:MAG: ABC transporter permease [Ruminococcaceae bacterium]|nr:ABC transporter permease [Oscillospiraceae bacterium]